MSSIETAPVEMSPVGINPGLDFSIVFVALAALTVLVVVISFLHLRAKHAAELRLTEGLDWLHRFRQLLTLVQQHRGLSNGYLCGDVDLLRRINPLQSKINQSSRALSQGGNWLAGNENWSGIESHWHRLACGFKSQTPANNLEQHNKLITSILYLIDDCAEQHRLYEMKDSNKRSIRYLWQELLVTAENIGQARAIGTGVAAAGACSSVDRIRLGYLHQAIDAFTGKDVDVQSGYRSGKSSVTALLKLLKTEVIVDKPAVSANAYFDAATLALEEVLKQFDDTLMEVKLDLQGATALPVKSEQLATASARSPATSS
ncbi:hypothetical protein ACFSJ3_05365 [Corallincola platygyrae]|uniref:Nitrate/nitrite sensing protein domain-containing protein n=1 Tax=Corallincola platygyrae TaxID=1193278 RepID=A0ABW4XIP4_9GAMM